jgi:hypothetical protein
MKDNINKIITFYVEKFIVDDIDNRQSMWLGKLMFLGTWAQLSVSRGL